jgi:thioesterase domain-containing protein
VSDEKTAAEREYMSRYKREIHDVDLLIRCSTNDLTTENARKAFDHLCKALVLHISHSELLWKELQQMKAKDESRFAANPEHFVVVSADEINAMRDEKHRARGAWGRIRAEVLAMRQRCDELIAETHANEGGGA